jgi:hypothetical protein
MVALANRGGVRLEVIGVIEELVIVLAGQRVGDANLRLGIGGGGQRRQQIPARRLVRWKSGGGGM